MCIHTQHDRTVGLKSQTDSVLHGRRQMPGIERRGAGRDPVRNVLVEGVGAVQQAPERSRGFDLAHVPRPDRAVGAGALSRERDSRLKARTFPCAVVPTPFNHSSSEREREARSDVVLARQEKVGGARGADSVERKAKAAKLKGEIERSKIINAMVSDRVKVEPEEVEALFQERFGNQKKGGEEVRLRHILVAVGGPSNRDEKTACALLEEAAIKIRAGQLDFNEAARQLTNMNPEQQGELGWMHTNEIAPWMSRSIATLKPGQVSEPIPMSFGCNLLQVVNFRSFTPVTLEQASGPLRSELINQKTDREIMAWLDSIREQTFISRKGQFAEGASANP